MQLTQRKAGHRHEGGGGGGERQRHTQRERNRERETQRKNRERDAGECGGGGVVELGGREGQGEREKKVGERREWGVGGRGKERGGETEWRGRIYFTTQE